MITSRVPRIEFDGNAVDIATDECMLRVRLADGREIAAPLEFFPRLRVATPVQRSQREIIGGGYGIDWEAIDEDISVRSLLRQSWCGAVEGDEQAAVPRRSDAKSWRR